MTRCGSCHRSHAHECRTNKPRSIPMQHGSRYTYVHGKCRCAECRLANKAYAQERLMRKEAA